MSNIRRGRRLDAPIDPKQPVVGTGVLDCPSGKFVSMSRNFARCASNNKAQSFLDWALLLRRVDKKDANEMFGNQQDLKLYIGFIIS